jgi:hypothetical protein
VAQDGTSKENRGMKEKRRRKEKIGKREEERGSRLRVNTYAAKGVKGVSWQG